MKKICYFFGYTGHRPQLPKPFRTVQGFTADAQFTLPEDRFELFTEHTPHKKRKILTRVPTGASSVDDDASEVIDMHKDHIFILEPSKENKARKGLHRTSDFTFIENGMFKA